MTVLPAFTSEGLLPIGDYELTFSALRQSMLVTGPGIAHPNWDAAWRAKLVDNLEVLVEQLWRVGLDEIFVDGSFVEDKDHPNDIDGYFVCPRERLTSGELERDLNLLDPHKVWTWDRVPPVEWTQKVRKNALRSVPCETATNPNLPLSKLTPFSSTNL